MLKPSEIAGEKVSITCESCVFLKLSQIIDVFCSFQANKRSYLPNHCSIHAAVPG